MVVGTVVGGVGRLNQVPISICCAAGTVSVIDNRVRVPGRDSEEIWPFCDRPSSVSMARCKRAGIDSNYYFIRLHGRSINHRNLPRKPFRRRRRCWGVMAVSKALQVRLGVFVQSKKKKKASEKKREFSDNQLIL